MPKSNYEVLRETKKLVRSYVLNLPKDEWERAKPGLLQRLFFNYVDCYVISSHNLVFKLTVKEPDNEYEKGVTHHYQIGVWEIGEESPMLSYSYGSDTSLASLAYFLRNVEEYVDKGAKRELAEKIQKVIYDHS